MTTPVSQAPTYDVADLPGLAGSRLAVGEWMTVDQDRIDRFADATDDHQWLHVDPVRAGAGPYGGTIAHGYLTLSLLIPLFRGALALTGFGMAINYGLNRVRFPAPVRAGSEIRIAVELLATRPVGEGLEAVFGMHVERRDGDRPACVAEVVYRYVPAEGGAGR